MKRNRADYLDDSSGLHHEQPTFKRHRGIDPYESHSDLVVLGDNSIDECCLGLDLGGNILPSLPQENQGDVSVPPELPILSTPSQLACAIWPSGFIEGTKVTYELDMKDKKMSAPPTRKYTGEEFSHIISVKIHSFSQFLICGVATVMPWIR